MSDRKTVYVVHCIDTEGPLHESLSATFKRLRDIFGLGLDPSLETLSRLQAGDVDLGGIEAAVQKVVNPHLLAYNDTWDKVDEMLTDCVSLPYRNAVPDSHGGGWVYNWFCVDHVDYVDNPRRRDIGMHNVFDHYREIIRRTGSTSDGVHFHYHPHGARKEAHRCATHWWAESDSLLEVLSRRIIDRSWFPAANRPGFHVTRPDSHWFLEQHIPFDFANQAIPLTDEDMKQADQNDGRFGDWRRAPVSWVPYHPAHDDYQKPGLCRRWIARCLNVGTRYRLLREQHVRQAFDEAREGKPVVLAFTNHDFRDMRPDIDEVRRMLSRVSQSVPDVDFQYSEAVSAMRSALSLPALPPCELAVKLERQSAGGYVVRIASDTPTFGPQPWLALKTRSGTYHYDNLDIDEPFHRWHYVLDEETFRLDALEKVGVAANNSSGTTTVALLDPRSAAVHHVVWNDSNPEPTDISAFTPKTPRKSGRFS